MRLLCIFLIVPLCAMEQFSGLYRKPLQERARLVCAYAQLSPEQRAVLTASLDTHEFVDGLSENVIGAYMLPLSVAPHFIVNGVSHLVAMVTEEKSVVAAASFGAKLAATTGGFYAQVMPPVAGGQIILSGITNLNHAEMIVNMQMGALIEQISPLLANMRERGGGQVSWYVHGVRSACGPLLFIELRVHTCDAMGAHLVTQLAELLAPELARVTGGVPLMGVVNNLAVQRMAYARAVWPRAVLGDECINRIMQAYACARADRGRCVTHNKGIMNGVDAVALATGNDFRALEAGAHGYAALGREYQPLTNYYVTAQGDLVGEIGLPLAVGIFGGATGKNPLAQVALQIMQVHSSDELACVMASVGLAQNFAALRALVQEGISHAFV